MLMQSRTGSASKLVNTMVFKLPMRIASHGASSMARAIIALEDPLTMPKSAEFAPRCSTKKRPVYGKSMPVPIPPSTYAPVIMVRGLKRYRRRRDQNERGIPESVASRGVIVSFWKFFRNESKSSRGNKRTRWNGWCSDLARVGRLAVIRKRGIKLVSAIRTPQRSAIWYERARDPEARSQER